MELSLGLSQRHELRQTLSQRLALTQMQRLSLENSLLTLRFELMRVIRGESFSPRGICKGCGRSLTPAEILAGFRRDPNDFTTECPRCKTRFEPELRSVSQLGSITDIGFLCPEQALDKLRGKEGFTTEGLQRLYPRAFYSALVHFGTIKGAFKEIGVDYPFSPLDGWEERVEGFLGKLPDTIIAECIGVSASTIGKLRRSLDISAFSKRKAAEAAGLI